MSELERQGKAERHAKAMAIIERYGKELPVDEWPGFLRIVLTDSAESQKGIMHRVGNGDWARAVISFDEKRKGEHAKP